MCTLRKGGVFLGLVLLCCGRASAISVPIGNASFEATTVPATASSLHMARWTLSTASSGISQFYTPATAIFPSQDGPQLGRIGVKQVTGTSRGTLYQDATIIQEGTYSVTVAVAHEPNYDPTTAPFSLNFESFGFGLTKILLASHDLPVGTFNSSNLTDVTTTVTIPAGHPAIGQFLRVVLNTQGSDPGVNTADPKALYNVDNVRLNYTPTGGITTAVPMWQSSFEAESWTNTTSGNASAGYYRPTTPISGQTGSQVGFVTGRNFSNSLGALFQDIAQPIAAGTYTWTVSAAVEPGFDPTTIPLKLNFEAYGTSLPKVLLASNPISVGTLNSSGFIDITGTVTIPEGAPAIGNTLRLVALAEGMEPGTNGRGTYLLDNMRLDFAGAALLGDYNSNGAVDAADYVIWRKNLGGTSLPNEGASTGVVDQLDYDFWRAHFGNTAGSGTALGAGAVPEPAGFATVITILAFIVPGLRRR